MTYKNSTNFKILVTFQTCSAILCRILPNAPLRNPDFIIMPGLALIRL